jgi:hypothetical protein
MLSSPNTNPNRSLGPDDLECVSAAFELTLRYLDENNRDLDLAAARNWAAKIIMARALEGEHDAFCLWTEAVRHLRTRQGFRVVPRAPR